MRVTFALLLLAMTAAAAVHAYFEIARHDKE